VFVIFWRREEVKFTTYLGPLKKLLPKICTQTRLPKTAKICAACTANWPMLPKNKLQKNIWYYRVFHRFGQAKFPDGGSIIG